MRAITYLSPGVPLGFYELAARAVGAAVGERVELVSDPRFSGPPPAEPNPLLEGGADLAFVCGPSYVRLAGRATLVPAAPVFDDHRADGRPVYFSEVVVPAGRPRRQLRAHAGARFAYNDPESLSGYLSVRAHLGVDMAGHFGSVLASGSHEASIEMLLAGEADVCAIDSVVWRRLVAARPRLLQLLQVVQTLGPFPIQPVIASPALGRPAVRTIASALRALGPNELGPYGASGFARVRSEDYRRLATLLPAA